MNDFHPAPDQLAQTLRQLIQTVRETRDRVLLTMNILSPAASSDDEAVHDFRVALRRMRTLLRAARDTWNTKKIVRIENDFRFFARCTGKLRDDEVLRHTLTDLTLSEATRGELDDWLEKRARVHRTERRAILRTVRDGPSRKEAWDGNKKPIRTLDEALAKLQTVLEDPPAMPTHPAGLMHEAVHRVIVGVQTAAHADVNDIAAMHTLRIRAKRLRYTAEHFMNELGAAGQRLVTHATRMQRRLGDLHDVDEAMQTISRARSLSQPTKHDILTALKTARTACAAKVEPLLIEARELDTQIIWSSNEPLSNSSS